LFMTAVTVLIRLSKTNRLHFEWVLRILRCLSVFVNAAPAPGPWLLSIWWIAGAKALGARTAGGRKGNTIERILVNLKLCLLEWGSQRFEDPWGRCCTVSWQVNFIRRFAVKTIFLHIKKNNTCIVN
jgi:hypothetical protein